MKRIILLCSLLVGSCFAFSQDFEGVITFGITYPNMTPEMKAMEGSLPKEMKYVVKGNKTKMEQSMMGGSVIVLFDGNTGNMETYTDVMGQKMKMVSTADEMNKSTTSDMDIQVEEGETKTIAGYSCKKVILKTSSEEELVLYVTEDIQIESVMSIDPKFKDLKGFPMEYEIGANGMNMAITAQRVEKKSIDDSVFDPPPGEYREMPSFGN